MSALDEGDQWTRRKLAESTSVCTFSTASVSRMCHVVIESGKVRYFIDESEL